MAADGDFLRHAGDNLGDEAENPVGVFVHVGRAAGEHREAVLIDDLNAEALGGVVQDQAARQFF